MKAPGSRACMGDATDATKALLQLANGIYCVFLAIVDAFPDNTTIANETRAVFVSACRSAEAPQYKLQLQQDLEYRGFVTGIVSATLFLDIALTD